MIRALSDGSVEMTRETGREEMNGLRRDQSGESPSGIRLLTIALLLVVLVFTTACTLRLEDRVAPSARVSVEVDYDFSKNEFVPTPPAIKRGEGNGENFFHLRTAFDNTFISYDAEGSVEVNYEPDKGPEVEESSPATAKGWGYKGSLHVMPGWSFGGDRFFIAPLVGLDLSILDMDVSFPELPDPVEDLDEGPFDFGRLTVPLGFRVETTIAHMVTPSFTWYWAPTIYEWETRLPGHDRVGQAAIRLWLGSIFKALGDHAWIEAGYRMTTYKTGVIFLPIDIYDFRFGGPFAGFGFTF